MQISDIVHSVASIDFNLYEINVLSIDLKNSQICFHIMLADYIKYFSNHSFKITERNIIQYEFEIRTNVNNISFFALLTTLEKETLLRRLNHV